MSEFVTTSESRTVTAHGIFNKNVIKRIQVWGKREVAFYVQVNNGSIEMDISEKVNPRPHTLYIRGNDGKAYFEESSFIPFLGWIITKSGYPA